MRLQETVPSARAAPNMVLAPAILRIQCIGYIHVAAIRVVFVLI